MFRKKSFLNDSFVLDGIDVALKTILDNSKIDIYISYKDLEKLLDDGICIISKFRLKLKEDI